MPYFTKVRMRANCDRGISRVVCGSGMTGALPSVRRFGADGEIPSTRGFRADWSAGGEPETNCSLT